MADTANTEPQPTADLFEENGDHSWEYYSEGKFVSYEEYQKSAHTSYYAT
jgi:hypothetical protein